MDDLKESDYAFLSFLTYKCCYNVGHSCLTKSKSRIMRYIHLEVSPAGCFSWLCMLCFRKYFKPCLTVMLMCTGLPYMGMPALCTQHCACFLPSSAQIPLCSALCFMDYCQHFVQMAPVVFLPVNEGQLTLLNFL